MEKSGCSSRKSFSASPDAAFAPRTKQFHPTFYGEFRIQMEIASHPLADNNNEDPVGMIRERGGKHEQFSGKSCWTII